MIDIICRLNTFYYLTFKLIARHLILSAAIFFGLKLLSLLFYYVHLVNTHSNAFNIDVVNLFRNADKFIKKNECKKYKLIIYSSLDVA